MTDELTDLDAARALSVALMRDTQAKAAEIGALQAKNRWLNTQVEMLASLNAKLITDMGRVGLENDALRALLAQPSEDWEASFASLTAEYDKKCAQVDALKAQWASVPWWKIVDAHTCSEETNGGSEILDAWLRDNMPKDAPRHTREQLDALVELIRKANQP